MITKLSLSLVEEIRVTDCLENLTRELFFSFCILLVLFTVTMLYTLRFEETVFLKRLL